MILVLFALESMIGLNNFLHKLCISGSLVRYLMLSIQPFFKRVSVLLREWSLSLV
jgi:hypothetical protein